MGRTERGLGAESDAESADIEREAGWKRALRH